MKLWCATLTPFAEGSSGHITVDLGRVRDHVTWLIERGVQGLAPTGTTGEVLFLRAHERAEVHRATLEAAGDVPVMPCVFDHDPGIMVDLARRAQDRGASAVFSPPPIYQPVHADDIVAWYERLVAAVTVPVYAYHHPRTHNPIDFPLFERLMDVGVTGLKDSSGDVRRVRLLAQVFPGKLLVGGDHLLGQGRMLGPIEGHLSGLANLRPRLCTALIAGGSLAKREALAAERDAIRETYAAAGRLPAMKQALGMGNRPPMTWVDPDKAAELVPDD